MLFPWMMGSLLPILGPKVIPGLSTALMVASFAVVLGVFRYHDRQSDHLEARS